MATSTLSDALAGLNFSPGDTSWGVGASTLAALAPKLINPYGNVGQNLGVGLGSVLLTALLQYQGKKSALESSLEANTIANDLMATTSTPEERVAYIKNLGERGVDSDVVGKLSTLGTALTQSDKQQAIETEARRQATLQDAYAKFAAEQGVPVEAVPGIWEQRYPTGGATAAGDAIARGDTVARPAFQTKEERIAAEAALEKQRTKVLEERSKLSNDPQVKEFNIAKSALLTAKDAAARNTEAGKQAVIMLFNRTLNPGNQVTLNEMDQTGRADTIYNKFAAGWNALTPNEKGVRISTMTPEALNELLSISRLTVDSMGKQYNEKVTNTVATLRDLGVSPDMAKTSNIGPVKLHLSQDESNKKANEVGVLTSKMNEIASRSDIPEETKTLAKDKLKQRLIELQTELNDFDRAE